MRLWGVRSEPVDITMKPYYSQDGIVIYHGDCREILPHLQQVDLVLTDPPYGNTSLEWDSRLKHWPDLVDQLTNNLWCFGSFRMFMEMARDGDFLLWNLAQEIVWEKHNGSGFHADRFKRVHELAVQYYRGEWSSVFKAPVTTPDALKKVSRRKRRPTHMGDIGKHAYLSHDGGPLLMRSVIFAHSCHSFAEHPTQKPVEIITPLLNYSLPAAGTVLDPFMGSGTTLVAAKRLGRRCIGIEIEERYCQIAVRRLAQSVLDFSDPKLEAVQEELAL